MRKTFITTLAEEARKNKNLFLLTGDLGFLVMEDFAKEFPKRFVNVGVQEANMIGMATGMALSGKTVVTYSIIPFTTARCIEQIRNDVCAHNANVKIVGVGQGYSYSVHGHTHHATDDVGMLRSIPNIKIISPGDPREVAGAVHAMIATPGPVYLRLAKVGEPIMHAKPISFVIGKGFTMKQGSDAIIISSGNMLESALKAHDILAQQKINVGIISMPTIKPIDSTIIKNAAKKTKVILTLEEHNILGGLGSAVAEVMAESKSQARLLRLGIPDIFASKVGYQEFMREALGISVPQIVSSVKKMINKK